MSTVAIMIVDKSVEEHCGTGDRKGETETACLRLPVHRQVKLGADFLWQKASGWGSDDSSLPVAVSLSGAIRNNITPAGGGLPIL